MQRLHHCHKPTESRSPERRNSGDANSQWSLQLHLWSAERGVCRSEWQTKGGNAWLRKTSLPTRRRPQKNHRGEIRKENHAMPRPPWACLAIPRWHCSQGYREMQERELASQRQTNRQLPSPWPHLGSPLGLQVRRSNDRRICHLIERKGPQNFLGDPGLWQP